MSSNVQPEESVPAEEKKSKLWGGRFSSGLDPLMEKFNQSIHIDKRLWQADIQGSKAYAKALFKAGLLGNSEKQQIIHGLDVVRGSGDEDIHTANERRLKEICGVQIGGKLHTGRSRNDQVATDMRMWLREELISIKSALSDLMKIITGRAKEYGNEYYYAWLYSYAESSTCSLESLVDEVNWCTCRKSLSTLTEKAWQKVKLLTLLPDFVNQKNKTDESLLTIIDAAVRCPSRVPPSVESVLSDQQVIESKINLGFKACSQNSMHAVGDRDFIAEFLFWASLAGTHFSKLAEDLIIFSTSEFGFVVLSDKFRCCIDKVVFSEAALFVDVETVISQAEISVIDFIVHQENKTKASPSTGSSLMPQKRNPDSLELIRGKSGNFIGRCTGFLTTLKGLPSTYNKDLQGDKEALFSVVDDMSNIIHIAAGVLSTMTVQPKRCIDALSSNMLATDVAYYLVRKGSHEIAGKVVSCAEKKECQLHQLEMEDFHKISNSFESDVLNLWDYEQSVEQYTALGGTSSLSVQIQIHKLESFLECNVYNDCALFKFPIPQLDARFPTNGKVLAFVSKRPLNKESLYILLFTTFDSFILLPTPYNNVEEVKIKNITLTTLLVYVAEDIFVGDFVGGVFVMDPKNIRLWTCP
ncbi:Argininosuccinate lyase [Nymphon striatum]|nr:Argininosuccinate lyase [Nymphon striatum]